LLWKAFTELGISRHLNCLTILFLNS